MRQPGDAAVSARNRLDFIDAVRGVASLVVVLHHTLESLSDGYSTWAHSHVDLGRVGIVAFFVVSGYVVALNLERQTPRTFAVRRFWRLFPIYWLATLLWVAVWLATGHELDAQVGGLTVVANVLMVQGFVGIFSILGPGWTLGIELAFYAQSVLAKLVRQLDRVALLGFGWLAVFAALALSNAVRGSAYSGVVPLMLFTATLGFALYRWDAHGDRTVFLLLAAALVVVPLLGVALGATEDKPGVWPATGFNASYLTGLALFASFYAVRARSMPGWLLWLGTVSYSLYLVHVTVIQVIGTTPVWAHPWLAVPAVAAVSLLGAGALYRYVERPTTDRGRRLTPDRARSRQDASAVRP